MSSLIIALDVNLKQNQVKQGDIILHDNSEYYSVNFKDNKLIYINLNISDTDPQVTDAVNKFFAPLPSELSFLKNKVYSRIFRPLCSVISQVKLILGSYSISRIILQQGNEIDFTVLEGGIGEGQKKMFKSSWFFNFYLNQFFKNDIEVLWHKTSKYNLKAVLFFRNFIGFIKMFFKSLRSEMKGHRDFILKSSKIKLTVLAFTSSLSEYKKLLDLIKTYYLGHDVVFFSSEDSKISKNNSISNLIKFKSISFKSFFRSFIKYKKIVKTIDDDLYFEIYNKKISINSRLFFKSIENYVIYNFASDLELMYEFNKHVIDESKVSILSSYTFTDEILLIRKLARTNAIKHVNFQTVSMAKVLLPDLDLADEYYLYSYKTYEFYKKKSSNFKYYSNFKNTEISNFIKSPFVLTVYLQPDVYADYYLELINLVADIIDEKELDWKIFIKFHPRQNKIVDFRNLEFKYNFVSIYGEEISLKRSFEITTFMISISSAVLYEALMYSCPGIIAQFNYIDDSYIYDNDICFPEVNFNVKHKKELQDILVNPSKYLKDYHIRRDNFINKQKLLSQI